GPVVALQMRKKWGARDSQPYSKFFLHGLDQCFVFFSHPLGAMLPAQKGSNQEKPFGHASLEFVVHKRAAQNQALFLLRHHKTDAIETLFHIRLPESDVES